MLCPIFRFRLGPRRRCAPGKSVLLIKETSLSAQRIDQAPGRGNLLLAVDRKILSCPAQSRSRTTPIGSLRTRR